ncbi:unnamed protein product [[Actinomadura] parvosata subsp. kistnae]|uniref:Uncharacterized protein n=1 Tax=[Actinomadura] parvosata subsp. kistnae TaxID=1909395 RepID=A0A1U9ZSA5_9ACTN|nr:hypothetical protein BKM31_04365 [Nonomuraea sp. ATCC 55076]SPL90520.1 unnamed protein product [Actinomadura parvosata subsp. kistnae]
MIVDPEVPPQDARVLRQSRDVLLRMRQGWTPGLLPRFSGPHYWMLAAFAPAACFGLLLSLGMMSAAIVMLLLAVPLALLPLLGRGGGGGDGSGAEASERAAFAQLRWYEGRYVLVDDLDVPAAALLVRARRAIATVTGSRVNADGLLDDVRNAVMLPEQEWEIARLLAKLSALRGTYAEAGAPGFEAVARALRDSEAAVLARVEALERYAAGVADAERAYVTQVRIEELRSRAHQYEDLAAEAGADAFAVPELERLAAEAARLARALRRPPGNAGETGE